MRARVEREDERVLDRSKRLRAGLLRAVERKGQRLEALAARIRPGRLAEETRRQSEALDRVSPRLDAAYAARLARLSDRLAALERTRKTLGYQATLERGYAVVRDGVALVTDVAGAKGARALEIEFKDGRFKPGIGE